MMYDGNLSAFLYRGVAVKAVSLIGLLRDNLDEELGTFEWINLTTGEAQPRGTLAGASYPVVQVKVTPGLSDTVMAHPDFLTAWRDKLALTVDGFAMRLFNKGHLTLAQAASLSAGMWPVELRGSVEAMEPTEAATILINWPWVRSVGRTSPYALALQKELEIADDLYDTMFVLNKPSLPEPPAPAPAAA